jgi:polysaccharide biosynthesis PFTS motif protein
MRGFMCALRHHKIDEIRGLESALARCEFAISPGLEERMLFGSLSPRTEIIVRQFLLQRYAGPKLRRALFCALGAKVGVITYPLPSLWQKLLIENGVAVNRWVSSLAWNAAILSRYLHGLFFVTVLCASGLVSNFFSTRTPSRKHACFHALSRRNLPHCHDGKLGYDICSWYVTWRERAPGVVVITHDVADAPTVNLGAMTVEFMPEPHTRLKNIRQVARFMLWAIPSLLLAFTSMLRGRWWNALMLVEAARAEAVRLADGKSLASDYLFHFSRSIYRPMWTYIAQEKGSRILCYFYSTYAQPQLGGKEVDQNFEWGPTTWPLFLVWDTYQADTLKRDLGQAAQVMVVGPIYFSDAVPLVTAIPKNAVAVFDIQPHRKSNTFGISSLYDYYHANPSVHKLFLEDIHATLREFGLSMVLKAKRYIGADGDRRYGTFVKKLAAESDVTIASSELAAPRLMHKCIGAISSPFTSTALYFQDQGYPSVYYDPLGLISKGDLAAHGIQVLTSRSELRAWVNTLL